MRLFIPSLNQAFLACSFANGKTLRWPCLLLLAMLLGSPVLRAQQAEAPPASDSQTIQLLLQRVAELEAKVNRIDQLEARIKQLESGKQLAPSAAVDPASVPAPASAPAPAPAQTNTSSGTEAAQQEMPAMQERMDLSKTLLRFRGFGDINLHGDSQKGDTTTFSLGQLNLFVTSDISEKFKFLSEIIFEGGPDNIYGVTTGQNNTFSVDVERYLIEYSYSDYFKLAAGRWHTAIGYYNTAYHHSTWFQTTTGRPFLFNFEDRGGILPIHSVGVSASGLIPSGPLGLHYVAEVGNGRASRTPLTEEPVQNVVDDQNHKAYNLAVFARPEKVRGLQVGFSVYRDVLAPLNKPRISESILAAHAVFVRPSFEWLNEALVVRHSLLGSSLTFNTPGFYSQISKQFGSWRPYFRYQYVNSSDSEPIFPDVRLREGPSVGLRYDASESVAVKLQYDYTTLRRQNAVNGLALQVGFTF
jgi:hypothetical protein